MEEHGFAEPEWAADSLSGDVAGGVVAGDGEVGGVVAGDGVVGWDDPVDSDDELAEALVAVGCLESAVRLALVRLVARLGRRGVWRAEGQTCMANWVALQCGVALGTARQIARVAEVIHDLPALAEAFGEGRLSWDQLVPLCRLACAESDGAWAVEGVGFSPEDLVAMVRARQVRERDARDAHEARRLVLRPDAGGGLGRISGLLPVDELEAVRVALDRIREQEGLGAVDPDSGGRATGVQQRADALVCLARRSLGADADVERSTVVLHADVGLLTGEAVSGHASLADGTPLAAETLRRRCCDTRVEWGIEGGGGVVLGVGRAARVWPAWLARLIRGRDGERCRFPGCDRRIHQIHHIVHWIPTAGCGPGGETTSANGVGLCFFHHHAVHEGGWSVAGSGDAEIVFWGPTGTRLVSRPRRLDPAVKRRLGGCAPHLWPTDPDPTDTD